MMTNEDVKRFDRKLDVIFFLALFAALFSFWGLIFTSAAHAQCLPCERHTPVVECVQ